MKGISDDSKDDQVRFAARIPKDLYAALCARRDQMGQSINDQVIAGIARVLNVEMPKLKKRIPGRKPQPKHE